MSDEKKEPELTPEQEALVGSFVRLLDGANGEPSYGIMTPIGPVRITAEQNEEIQRAAVTKTIELINREQNPLIMRIAGHTFWTVLTGLILAGGFAGVRSIVGF